MANDRFVILHHLAPTGEHWDLMLELADGLATWQVLARPAAGAVRPIACVRIKDHRKMYLDYEGPVSGGRGVVTRVDRGRYELLTATDSEWAFRLKGSELSGDFRLGRTVDEDGENWVLTCC